MIATPTHDGKLDVKYVDSLISTLAIAKEVSVFPVFLPGEALVQKARNELFKIAAEAFEGKGVDDLVFIDSDMAWNPMDFMHLLSHEQDIVGGLCRQKRDEEILTFKPKPGAEMNKQGLLEVNGTGCAFLRLTNSALMKIWNVAKPYKNGNQTGRAVFEVFVNEDGDYTSEDISFCNKWFALGGQVYIDTMIRVTHIGTKAWIPNVFVP